MVNVRLRSFVNNHKLYYGLFKLVMIIFNSFYFTMDTAHTDHSSRAQHKGPPPLSLSSESKCIICPVSFLNHLLHSE